MSTRAIFAKALTDGTYIGGWQWNDGGSYTASKLNQKPSNEEIDYVYIYYPKITYGKNIKKNIWYFR